MLFEAQEFLNISWFQCLVASVWLSSLMSSGEQRGRIYALQLLVHQGHHFFQILHSPSCLYML